MSDQRILIWHIPYPGFPLPAYYLEKDYTPKRVRIHADSAPNIECEIDIRDDGVSIFNNRTSTLIKKSTVYSEIQYNTLSGTFQVGEFITGGTSNARGTIISNKLGNMTLELWDVAAFSVDETITGATSGATATILSFYHGSNPATYSTGAAKTTAMLSKEETLEEAADDFIGETIEEGSIMTCHEIEMGGAVNVTIQLELESLDEEDERDAD